MKHTDNELQAAIDAALIESEANVCEFAACPETFPKSWAKESPARLALAKAFLAKLPEPQPIIADDGRSLGQVAFEGVGWLQKWETCTTNAKWQKAAQAVASVVLAQAIRRMEAVPVEALGFINISTPGGFKESAEAIRARLIAAARGETEQQPDNTDWKAKYEQAEAERKKWEEDALHYCQDADYWKTRAEKAEAEAKETLHEAEEFREEYHADMVGFRDRAEKAEAELAALKSSQLSILRQLSEALRCVTTVSKIEDLVTTDHETKDAFIARVRDILGHNDQAI